MKKSQQSARTNGGKEERERLTVVEVDWIRTVPQDLQLQLLVPSKIELLPDHSSDDI